MVETVVPVQSRQIVGLGVEGGDRAVQEFGELVVAQRGDVLGKLELIHERLSLGER
ncbi:hypothetical protein ACNF49_18610 [Actinomadura sp. ATCC 39365]|uniref:hypothetical protein n=1 Tax=Nonomuraea sp. NPDC005692 TaxID=3157168 RepID=UPI0033D6DFA9